MTRLRSLPLGRPIHNETRQTHRRKPQDQYRFGLLFVALSFNLLFLSGCMSPHDTDYSPLRSEDSSDPAQHTAFFKKEGSALSGEPFITGNDVQLLRDGNETFPAMLASIRKAKHYIYMESFTFDAKAGKTFAEALVKRRKAGVKVDLIYDAFGSSETPPGVFDYLKRSGVHLTEYNPIEPVDVVDGSADNRDHRKILITDGKEAFVGGVNISAVYLHKQAFKRAFDSDDADAYRHIPWRDTHIKITGPAVDEFVKIYKHTWTEQHGDQHDFSAFPTDLRSHGDISVEALYGAPQSGQFKIYDSLLMAITLAQHSIKLTTGYFVPTPGLLNALISASRRGVDVILLLPSSSDSDLALAAGHADYSRLLAEGIKIYEFQNEVLHAKTAVIDGTWSTVGSSNLDWRSAVINNECNAVILGTHFGSQLDAMFQDDLLKSKQITQDEWEDRSFEEKFDEFKASLIDYFL